MDGLLQGADQCRPQGASGGRDGTPERRPYGGLLCEPLVAAALCASRAAAGHAADRADWRVERGELGLARIADGGGLAFARPSCCIDRPAHGRCGAAVGADAGSIRADRDRDGPCGGDGDSGPEQLDAPSGATVPARDLRRGHRLRVHAGGAAGGARLAHGAGRGRPRAAVAGRPALDAGAADGRLGDGELSAQAVRRHQAVLAGGARCGRTAAQPHHQRGGRRRRARCRDGHGPPRPPQCAHQHHGQERLLALPRLRRPGFGALHRPRRCEVSPRLHQRRHLAEGQQGGAEPLLQPEPPRVRGAGCRGPHACHHRRPRRGRRPDRAADQHPWRRGLHRPGHRH